MSETLANRLKALGHPIRLRIICLLATEREDIYLNETAKRLETNRALAKIHLKKLESADIVKSRVVLIEREARALRYHKERLRNLGRGGESSRGTSLGGLTLRRFAAAENPGCRHCKSRRERYRVF